MACPSWTLQNPLRRAGLKRYRLFGSRGPDANTTFMTRLASISTLVLAAALGFAQTTPVTKTATSSTTTTSSTTASKPAKKKSGKHAKPEPVKVAEPPAPPPPPPTLAQQPPVAPTVTYRNGLLSIDAPNSTLGDILNGIRRATGATIEGPSFVGDRVIVHLGPGQPRQVVASLLGSSRFDFIVMGTPQQPNGVNRLVLMARQGGNQQPAANNGAPPPYTAQPQRPPVAADSDEEEDQEAPDRDENSYQPPSQPAQPQGNPAQAPQLPPDQMAPQQGQQQPQDQNQEANPNAPKTPEQLYKELQNLERQRQQQTQNPNQNQEPPPPPQ
jgi:hypothetical protein